MVTRRLPRRSLFARALWLCAALCVLCGAVRAEGATSLDEYRSRVNQSKELVEELSWLYVSETEPDEHESETSPEEMADLIAAAEARLPGEVRRLLPPTETVEWAQGNLTVDNSWVHQAIDEYRQKTNASSDERVASLWLIVERLGALDARLAEFGIAGASPARDKEAEKGQLAAILRRLETSKAKKAEEGALNRLVKQIRDWLQSLFPRSSRIVPGASPRLTVAAQIFIYALALGVVAFVLWKFRAVIFRRRRVRKKRTEKEARVVLGERLAPDQTAADLLAEAERLARGGDPRGAIRKAYVAFLCELGDRKIIRLARHKTNRDYLGAVRERPELYSEMKPLTMNYEKHWYGFEAATDGDWADFRARCRVAMSPKSKVQSPKSETVS